jgi:O-antigen ligase
MYRIGLAKTGLELFKNRPILGAGINNFAALFGSLAGVYTYAHNNYIELLVGVGLFGFVIYYSGYVYIIKKAISLKKNDLQLSSLALTLIVSLLILEIALVSYVDFTSQFLICIAFCAINIVRHKSN